MNRELLDIIKSVKSVIELEKASGLHECLLPESAKVNESQEGALESLEMNVLSCRMCPLARSRNNTVFGTGSPRAKLMFVGEGPGYEEDMQGLPFVGRAGKLLTKIIEAMKLKRKDVYIANIVKCRPPNNRNPLPTEILSCEEYLTAQINIIKPRVICALGKVSAQTLLKSQTPISRLRGRFYDYQGTKLMPTFHPAYLLRNPADKNLVWQDMKKIMKEL